MRILTFLEGNLLGDVIKNKKFSKDYLQNHGNVLG
jgi:hypothetical protein